MKDQEVGPERKRILGHPAPTVDGSALHHGTPRREKIIEAEARELERRARATEERRRLYRRPGEPHPVGSSETRRSDDREARAER